MTFLLIFGEKKLKVGVGEVDRLGYGYPKEGTFLFLPICLKYFHKKVSRDWLKVHISMKDLERPKA